MDIEKLIEQLNNLEACAYGYYINGEVLGIDCSDFEQIMVDAAEEISKIPTLQAELEQVKAERDAAVSWAQKFTESIDRPCVACKHNTGYYVCTAICGNCGPMGTESCKWEFDFSGELKED